MFSINDIKIRYFLAVFCLVCINSQNLSAASPIVLEERNDGLPLGLHLDILEDKEGRLTIEEISSEKLAPEFVANKTHPPSFGYTQSVYWARFTVKNPTDKSVNWFLEIEYPYMDYIDLYIPVSPDSFTVKKTGQFRPFSSRDVDYRNFVFSQKEAPKSERIYYLRFQSEDAMIFIPTLWFEAGFQKKVVKDHMIFGLFYGIALAMLIYNFFLFLSVREIAYLYYVFALAVAFFFLFFVLDGLASQYLWPNWVGWANYSLAISIILFILTTVIFIRTFLNTAVVIPKWDRGYLFFSTAYLISSVIALLASYFWGIIVIVGGAVLYCIFLGTIAILCLKSGSRPARYFFIATTFLVLGAFTYLIKTLGLIQDNLFANNALKIGGVIQVLVFSLGLADRINIVKKEREDAQQKAIENLKTAEKLKDEFLANTSHELRTPLNGIIGIAESLIDGAAGSASKQMKTNLSMIVSSGKRLSNLVNDILDFSKLKNHDLLIQRKSINIRILTDIVLSISKPLLAGKKIDLINRISSDTPTVNGDENRLQQILINLVGNAIKFTEKGEISILSLVKNGMVEVSVVDTGIGIPKERLQDIFKSFEQVDASTEREYGGTGLGLSVTKQLVELHGGTVRVASNMGEGSIFTFTLPISSEPAAEMEDHTQKIVTLEENDKETGIVEPELIEHKLSILIVDDDLVNLQVLENHLSLQHYSVSHATSGMEALNAIDLKRPDIILLDVMMPKMSGYEVCEKIRETYSATQLPVLMLTAKNQVSDLVDGFTSGANDYLPKPFSKNELLMRVKAHLELSQTNRAYEKFVPHEFISLLNRKSIIEVGLGENILIDMSILFADIRAFTSLSEKITPHENFAFLNSYLEKMEPVVRKHKGFIDKYIGDSIMALFNTNADDAVKAGIEMLNTLTVYNEGRKQAGYDSIKIGIGINSGPLMLGTIGGSGRMEGTVIADAVNLASRVEGLTKIYASPILITQNTYEALLKPEDFILRKIDRVRVKGKAKNIEIWEVLDNEPVETRERKMAVIPLLNKAVSLYSETKFQEALEIFHECLDQSEADKIPQVYINRCENYLKTGWDKNWDGSEEITQK